MASSTSLGALTPGSAAGGYVREALTTRQSGRNAPPGGHLRRPWGTPSALVEAVTRELDGVGRFGTVAGQAAVLLAGRIASRREAGAATAALAKQLSATMDRALGGVAKAVDPLDEIWARRDAKRSAGRL